MGLSGTPSSAGPAAGLASSPRALNVIVAALTAVSAAIFVAVFVLAPPWHGPDRWLLYFVLSVALIVADFRPIALSRGTDEPADWITISTPFAVALLVVAPLSVVLVVQSLAVLLDDLRARRAWRKTCFNVAQYVVSLVIARIALHLTGGPSVLAGHEPFGVDDVIPTVVAGTSFIVVNYLLVAVVVSLDTGESFRVIVAHDARFTTAMETALVSLAPLTNLVVEAHESMVFLLLLPLLALHRNASQAMDREAAALRDSLTGLGNRKLFELHGKRMLDQHPPRNGEDGPAVLLVSLSHFAEINDTLGHAVGDDVLVEVGRRLVATLPDDAVTARLGDQFAIMVPEDRSSAERLAMTLLDRLDTPAELGDLRLLVQANVGLAVAGDHGSGVEELLRKAAIAFHDATQQGVRISTYTPDAQADTGERLQLLSELRTAIDEKQLHLVFQPQVAVATGDVVGVEALVRWQHPTRGLVHPDAFIALAENSGLIAQVTAVVLDQALATAARLHAEGHALRIAVNMSARQMSDITLPGVVAEALAQHGVPAPALTLEVTETGILSEPARVDAVVRALRETGVSIAVDDYGTGQASLTYLKRLHVDELKIDKSFVIDMRTDSGDAIIVRSTIELGHDLGLRIVAEGVEDAATLLLLRRLGSDFAQGWHIGRPMTEQDLRSLLDGQRPAPLVRATPA